MYFIFVDSPNLRGVCLPGQTDVFPVCVPARLCGSFLVCRRSWLRASPEQRVLGRLDVFPGRDWVCLLHRHVVLCGRQHIVFFCSKGTFKGFFVLGALFEMCVVTLNSFLYKGTQR